MPNDSAFPKSLLAAALSAAFPFQTQAQTAARIDFAAGNVTASTADGRTRNLAKGAEVQVGETVNTQQGRAQMRFTDGAFVSLQPETQFKIENYVFEGRSTPNESAVMSLVKGGFRTISGLIGKTNRDGYKLQTATATVGIRGTEFSVVQDAGGSVSMFVAGGAIAVTNQSGTTVVPGGRSTTVSSQNSAPQTTNEKPFLPPENLDNTKVEPPKQPFAPPPAPILTGEVLNPGFAYAYTEPPANFAYPRNDVTAAALLNGSGTLVSFTNTQYVYANEGYTQTLVATTNGSSQSSAAGNDGIIAWGRWIGGADSNGKDLSVGGNGYGPFHWIVGVPVPAMPTTGTASYDIMGATASCAGFCTSVPVVTGSKLDVNFGTNSGQSSTNININGVSNTFASSVSLYSSGQFNTSSSSNGYYFEGAGFFAGSNAARAGMAYTAVSSNNSYSNPTALSVSGVIAYKQTSSNGLGTTPRNP
jgi:FecR protein